MIRSIETTTKRHEVSFVIVIVVAISFIGQGEKSHYRGNTVRNLGRSISPVTRVGYESLYLKVLRKVTDGL